MVQNRTITIKGVFAESASTIIPSSPVAGVSYRDTAMTGTVMAKGWAFKTIVDSSEFNEALYEYSYISKQLETCGFLPWCQYTDYVEGAICLGSNNKTYQAKQATGPSTTARDPVLDTANTYWKEFLGQFVTTDTTQIVSGNKTFSGSVSLGSSATATTPTSATDHSTSVATTQWFRNAITNLGVQHLTKYEDIGNLPYTAPIDGIMRVRIGATYNWELYINGIIVQQQNRNDSDSCTTTWVTIPVKQGDVLTKGSGTIHNKEMYYPY